MRKPPDDSSAQLVQLSQLRPTRHRAATSHPCCVLSKCLTQRVNEPTERAVFIPLCFGSVVSCDAAVITRMLLKQNGLAYCSLGGRCLINSGFRSRIGDRVVPGWRPKGSQGKKSRQACCRKVDPRRPQAFHLGCVFILAPM